MWKGKENLQNQENIAPLRLSLPLSTLPRFLSAHEGSLIALSPVSANKP